MIPKKFKTLVNLLGNKVSLESNDLQSYAGDLWPRRLIRERLGEKMILPGAVVHASRVQDIQKLLVWANETKTSVIPFGGGSGVCGAAQTLAEEVVVDLRGMSKVNEIDSISLYMRAEAGILGPDLEKALNSKGLTLAHFPASFFISTLGGWVSTRACGQFSTAYGSIEDILLALDVVLPNGSLLKTKLVPRAATGPSLRELFLGAEGTLGIVTEATCQVQKVPSKRLHRSYSFDDLSVALDNVREIIQKRIFPAVIRLYDETDTQLMSNEIHIPITGNLLILIFEGEEETTRFQTEMTEKIILNRGQRLDEKVAKHWWDHRFDLNEKKMKEILSQQGMILDTIEVATTWSQLKSLYDNVKKAMGSQVLVMAHFSHMYQTGASIYFTFVGNVEEKDALNSYDGIWQRAMEACLNFGGTISHHHGIGLLKKEWLKKELNEGWDLLLQIKNVIDPNHILNPGKLI